MTPEQWEKVSEIFHAASELAALPEPLRRLEQDVTYKVEIGKTLRDLTATLDRNQGLKGNP